VEIFDWGGVGLVKDFLAGWIGNAAGCFTCWRHRLERDWDCAVRIEEGKNMVLDFCRWDLSAIFV